MLRMATRSFLARRLPVAGPTLLALLLAAPLAQAHDTWFQPALQARAGHWQLALGTGDRFPRQDYPLTADSLRQQGCRLGDGPVLAMQPFRMDATSLHLRARVPGGARRGQSDTLTCWAELQPLDITIEPAKVQRYLDEIAAPPAVRAAWQGQQARGVRWLERYRKSARIELRDPRLGGGEVPPAQPVPVAMDIVFDGGLPPLHAGDEVRFRVLRNGQPLPGQAIEARSALSPLGLWVRTDAEGRAGVRLPLPGAWLLRGTHLQPAADRPDAWESDFVTLAFDVAPRPR